MKLHEASSCVASPIQWYWCWPIAHFAQFFNCRWIREVLLWSALHGLTKAAERRDLPCIPLLLWICRSPYCGGRLLSIMDAYTRKHSCLPKRRGRSRIQPSEAPITLKASKERASCYLCRSEWCDAFSKCRYCWVIGALRIGQQRWPGYYWMTAQLRPKHRVFRHSPWTCRCVRIYRLTPVESVFSVTAGGTEGFISMSTSFRGNLRDWSLNLSIFTNTYLDRQCVYRRTQLKRYEVLLSQLLLTRPGKNRNNFFVQKSIFVMSW